MVSRCIVRSTDLDYACKASGWAMSRSDLRLLEYDVVSITKQSQ